VLLLDEPLSALDDETWEGMIGLLGQVRKAAGVTILHVTHRREEARRLADRVFVLADGAVRPAAAADLQEQTR
jgi:iron(III) transport system ATP-binding protein